MCGIAKVLSPNENITFHFFEDGSSVNSVTTFCSNFRQFRCIGMRKLLIKFKGWALKTRDGCEKACKFQYLLKYSLLELRTES